MSADRVTIHNVTGITPNQVMLGREVLLSATLIAKPPEEPINVSVPFVSEVRDHTRNAHQLVRQSTKSAVNEVQKTYYDKRVTGPVFAVRQ